MPDRRQAERRAETTNPLIAFERRLDARFETIEATLASHREALSATMRAMADRQNDLAQSQLRLENYQREANGRLGQHDVQIAEINQEVRLRLVTISTDVSTLTTGLTTHSGQIDQLRLDRATEDGRRSLIIGTLIVVRDATIKLLPFLATGAALALVSAALAWLRGM